MFTDDITVAVQSNSYTSVCLSIVIGFYVNFLSSTPPPTHSTAVTKLYLQTRTTITTTSLILKIIVYRRFASIICLRDSF